MRGTMRGAAAVLAVALAVAGCGGGGTAASSPTAGAGASADGAATHAFARELFDRSNKERVAEGLEPLAWSDCLEQKAAERAAPFVDDPDLTHDVLVATCHPGATAGENLSRSDRTASEVVEAWMGSAGHRANILTPEFLISGVACADADDGVRACAQLFEGLEAAS